MSGMVSDRNKEECKPEKTKQLEMKLFFKNISISRKSM